MQKESAAAQEEMRKIREEIDRNEERFRQLSYKVDKNKMVDAELAAELQGLQTGEERRGSNASHTGDCCMEDLWQQFVALGAYRIEVFVQRLQRKMGTAQGQTPGREEGRRNSEDEQEQDKASQQLALSASSWCNEGTPASSLELDLPRVRSALGECGGAGKLGTAKDERKRLQSNSPSRRPMEEEDASLGNL